MKCAICRHGETVPGFVTVTLERAGTVVVVREAPAEVCGQCGEYFLDEKTTARVLGLASEAVERRAEVEIVRYAA
ncbi:MAG: type II toxin-antitoxin system MqsA family antitoxin [Magnetococcales bacterium]|nr:type II toxin-antitoxin system MqsA family antitoxin [Magnetococcales bacterium]